MNNTGILHLRDKAVLKEDTGDCELLIRISSGKLSYAIVSPVQKRVLVLFDTVLLLPLSEVINELLTQNQYLNYSFRRIKVAAETYSFTFVPADLYSSEALPVYKNLVRSYGPSLSIVNDVRQANLKSLASISDALSHPLSTRYPQAAFYAFAEPLITGMLNYDTEGKNLVLQFNNGTFEAVYVSGGEFIFYNIFTIASANDFNYFLLLIMEQLDLSVAETTVVLAGDIEKYNENYQRVAKYFTKIHFAESHRFFSYPDSFAFVPSHQFFALLNLALCE